MVLPRLPSCIKLTLNSLSSNHTGILSVTMFRLIIELYLYGSLGLGYHPLHFPSYTSYLRSVISSSRNLLLNYKIYHCIICPSYHFTFAFYDGLMTFFIHRTTGTKRLQNMIILPTSRSPVLCLVLGTSQMLKKYLLNEHLNKSEWVKAGEDSKHHKSWLK